MTLPKLSSRARDQVLDLLNHGKGMPLEVDSLVVRVLGIDAETLTVRLAIEWQRKGYTVVHVCEMDVVAGGTVTVAELSQSLVFNIG